MCLKTQLSWLFILFLCATKLRIGTLTRSRQSFRWQRGPELIPRQLFQWRLEVWHDTTLTWHHFFASEARKKLLLRKEQTCRILSWVTANPNFWMISAQRGGCLTGGRQAEGRWLSKNLISPRYFLGRTRTNFQLPCFLRSAGGFSCQTEGQFLEWRLYSASQCLRSVPRTASWFIALSFLQNKTMGLLE